MKYIFLGLIAIATLLTGNTPLARAETATFKQRILPIDCVFDTINDGSGTLYFYTPEECGVIIPPDSPTPTPNTPTPEASPNVQYSFIPLESNNQRLALANGDGVGRQSGPQLASWRFASDVESNVLHAEPNNWFQRVATSPITVAAAIGTTLFLLRLIILVIIR